MMTNEVGVFELMRDFAFFELFKDLDVLEQKLKKGISVSHYEKQEAFRTYENKVDLYTSEGLNKEELKELLKELKTNPIAKRTYGSDSKLKYVILEVENLINGNYNKEDTFKNMALCYGEDNEEVVELILKNAVDNILESNDISIIDRFNHLLLTLQKRK